MADKIANFEDYVKRDVKQENKEKKPSVEKEAEVMPKPPVNQETMEIEIEDPFQFLTAEERDEYLEQRRLEAQKEAAEEASADEPVDESGRGLDKSSETPGETEAEKASKGEAKADHEKAKADHSEKEHREPQKNAHRDGHGPGEKRHRREDQNPEEKKARRPVRKDYPDEDYDDGYEEKCAQEEESAGGVNMDLVVRVASVITGMIILFFVGMFFKLKVVDRFMAPDPDEVQTVVAAIPEGFTEKNDTVVVTGASSLNLRSGPDTSSTIITAANEGTELKRIAVADDGGWAFVEYEGQQLYASMKYLKEK